MIGKDSIIVSHLLFAGTKSLSSGERLKWFIYFVNFEMVMKKITIFDINFTHNNLQRVAALLQCSIESFCPLLRVAVY